MNMTPYHSYQKTPKNQEHRRTKSLDKIQQHDWAEERKRGVIFLISASFGKTYTATSHSNRMHTMGAFRERK